MFSKDPYKRIKYYDINFIEYTPDIKKHSKHPYYLLVEALNFLGNDNCKILINQIKKKNGKGNTVWALKKSEENNSSEYDIEFYFYYKDSYPMHEFSKVEELYYDYTQIHIKSDNISKDYQCISFNLLKDNDKGINYYTTNFNEQQKHIDINNVIKINKYNHEAYSYLIDKEHAIHKKNIYINFFNKKLFGDFLDKIYDICREKFKNQNIGLINNIFNFPYLNNDLGRVCFPITLGIKENSLGLYFERLNIEQFVCFLKHHRYNENFITFVVNNKSKFDHIRYDIVIDVKLENNELKIIKTAFWGTF